MSAPEGRNDPISREDAVERVQDLVEDDRHLQSVLYTGGETEYAHIYLAAVTGTYNGNQMLWVRYVWLSKPGAYESDMWGDNGINIRVVDGMGKNLGSMLAAACNRLTDDEGGERAPFYAEA